VLLVWFKPFQPFTRFAPFKPSEQTHARDRRSYLRWVLQAKRRFGLVVLNYAVTSNPIHLLLKDTGANVIANSMQLIAGRTAQEYNRRKARHGAFWEDRYHVGDGTLRPSWTN
jgi:hypothetical protein